MVHYGNINLILEVMIRQGFEVYSFSHEDIVEMVHKIAIRIENIKVIQVEHWDEQVCLNKAYEELSNVREELNSWKSYPELNDPH